MPWSTLQNWSGRYAAVPGSRQSDEVPIRCPFFLSEIAVLLGAIGDVPFSLLEPKGSGAWRLFTLHGAVHETDPELPRLDLEREDLAASEDAEFPGPLAGSLHRPDEGRLVEPALAVIAEDGVSRFEADRLRLTARNDLGGHQARRDRIAVDAVIRDVERAPSSSYSTRPLRTPYRSQGRPSSESKKASSVIRSRSSRK